VRKAASVLAARDHLEAVYILIDDERVFCAEAELLGPLFEGGLVKRVRLHRKYAAERAAQRAAHRREVDQREAERLEAEKEAAEPKSNLGGQFGWFYDAITDALASHNEAKARKEAAIAEQVENVIVALGKLYALEYGIPLPPGLKRYQFYHCEESGSSSLRIARKTTDDAEAGDDV